MEVDPPHLADFTAIRPSQAHFYHRVPLYRVTGEGDVALYKASGVRLTPQRLSSERYPPLYIRTQDRLSALNEAQQAYRSHFLKGFEKADPVFVKTVLMDVVDDLFHEARVGVLAGMFEEARSMIGILVEDHLDQVKGIAGAFVDLDYCTALHSVNVMAISIGFAGYAGFNAEEQKLMGLTGFLHDIGKAQLDREILFSDRKLTDGEFRQMKKHPIYSRDILQKSEVPDFVVEGALEHHERLDGRGYPFNKTEISFVGRCIGIIDAYEALTCDDRPYRRRVDPYSALFIIRQEVEKGLFDPDIYASFVKSLRG